MLVGVRSGFNVYVGRAPDPRNPAIAPWLWRLSDTNNKGLWRLSDTNNKVIASGRSDQDGEAITDSFNAADEIALAEKRGNGRTGADNDELADPEYVNGKGKSSLFGRLLAKRQSE